MRLVALFAILALHTFAQPAFEVASVREHHGPGWRSGPPSISSPLVRLEGYTVYGLLMDAFGLKGYQLAFGSVAPPDDIYNAQYDVLARAPGDAVPSAAEVRVMLQNLLAERFKLRAHRETREKQVYLLQTTKSPPNLSPGSSDQPCAVHAQLAADGRNNEETLSNCPIEELAGRLTDLIGGNRPVLDRTGLQGRYDIRLIAIPQFRSSAQNDPADIDPLGAVRELGLKLVSEKAPIEILVVDHVEKPTGN